MSFNNQIAKEIYMVMDSVCTPIFNFFEDFKSELQEVWLNRNKKPELEEEKQEEEKIDKKIGDLTLKSFKSIKKGTLLYFGLENSGKTSFLKQFTRKTFENTTPTQGFNVYNLQFHGYLLTCWDFGGNKNLRGYWENYITEEISGIVYIIDGTDETKIKENLEVLIFVLNLVNAILGKQLPILVFANKSDCEMKVNVVKFVEEAKTATNYEGIMLAEEGSALQANNVEESMGYFLEFIK